MDRARRRRPGSRPRGRGGAGAGREVVGFEADADQLVPDKVLDDGLHVGQDVADLLEPHDPIVQTVLALPAPKDAAGDRVKAVDRCFDLLLGRHPSDTEREACLELAKTNDLSLVCRALINSNEFAFLP